MSDEGQQPDDIAQPASPPSGEAPPPPPSEPPPSTPPPPSEPSISTPPPPSAPPGPDMAPPPPAGQEGYGSPPPPSGFEQPGAEQPAYGQPGSSQPGVEQQWSAPAVAPMANTAGAGATEDTGSAVIAQVLALLTGVLGTGIFYAVSNDKSPFVRHHATEALNFSITILGAYLVTGITVIGLLLWPVLWIAQIVLPIMAAMAANKGEWYRYPATLRLVKGPLDQPGAAQGQPGGGQGY